MRKKKGEVSEGSFRSMFCRGVSCSRKGESRRAADHRPTAPSPCPVGHPRPCGCLGTSGPTWRGGAGESQQGLRGQASKAPCGVEESGAGSASSLGNGRWAVESRARTEQRRGKLEVEDRTDLRIIKSAGTLL
jgi:hypothetical protein